MLNIIYKIFPNYLTTIFNSILVVFYVYQDATKWSIVKFINADAQRLNIDSFTVLHYAECYDKIGDRVFEINDTCSSWIYGSFTLRILSFFKIFHGHEQIGHVFTYSILLISVSMISKYFWNPLIQTTLFVGFISPPIWLLLERANFDALIFVFIYISGILFQKGYVKSSLSLILACTLIKFYTLPILLIAIVLIKKKMDKILAFVYSSIALLIILSDLSKMTGFPIQAGYNHFGMKIIGNYLGKINIRLDIYLQYIISAIIFLAFIFVTLKFLKQHENRYVTDLKNSIFIFGKEMLNFIVFISCFVVGLSVDYRLIFYIASVGYFLTLMPVNLRIYYSIVFVFSIWLTYPTGNLQTIGDLALEIVAALQIAMILNFMVKNNKFILGLALKNKSDN